MLFLQGHTGPVRCLAYSPDGRTLASGGDDKSVRLWDLSAGSAHRTLSGHDDSVRAVAFSPDGTHILTGGWDDQTFRTDITRRGTRLTHGLQGQGFGGVWSVAIGRDGMTTAAGFANGTIRLSLRKDLAPILKGHQWPVNALAFSPDGWTLASAGHDRTIRLWDSNYGRERAVLVAHRDWVRTLAYSPDGASLASGCEDGTLKLWSVSDSGRALDMPVYVEEVAAWPGHAGRVCQVAFTPDGRTLISVGWDGTIRFWDVQSRRERTAFQFGVGRIHCAAIAQDGMTAAAGGDQGIVVWDLDG